VTDPGVVTLKHFFERVREGELTGIRCTKCGALEIPPRALCPACHARAWEPAPLAGEGVIASFTVIRVAPRAHEGAVPYAIAAVRLTEGPSVLGRVVDIPLERLAIGLPVRFRPLVRGAEAAIGFGPA